MGGGPDAQTPQGAARSRGGQILLQAYLDAGCPEGFSAGPLEG